MKVSPSTWVTCHAYADRTPILALHGEHGSLSIYTPTAKRSSESDQKFARELVRAANEFMAEVERLRVEQEPAVVQ
jgi:hypothetical protein